ncbi:DNA glycosylase AlkZ-like family protein, partial [Streptomyces europaeiscabiei]|uniref:DNA glycosylase AlkZ-like family protein n=1 Tax=Streptomyces europaeiscabiei TaxID=146819 RepID=UPI0029A03FE3
MTSLPRPTTELTADEARRIALRAQGFLGAPDRRSGVRGVLRHLGAVQLDTISVLARSHELIPYARLGAVGRTTVDNAYWTTAPPGAPSARPHAFEYWSHAACILPIEEWPHFAFRRRAYRARPHWNHQLPDDAYDRVIKQLRTEGPLTATELGGAKRTSEWWDWSGEKVAVERALMYGEVVCVERRGWKRVSAPAGRAIAHTLLPDEPDGAECPRPLVGRAGAS